MPDDFVPHEERLCSLSYSELTELSKRLDETTQIIRNPAVRADIEQACRAVSDLASERFYDAEIRQITDQLNHELRGSIERLKAGDMTALADLENNALSR